MEIEFLAADAPLADKAVLAIVVFEGEAEKVEGGAYAPAVAASRFTGAKGQTLDILAPAQGAAARVLLIGAGKADAFDDIACENAAASTLQPEVNAAGKKYTTTGPCFSAALRS